MSILSFRALVSSKLGSSLVEAATVRHVPLSAQVGIEIPTGVACVVMRCVKYMMYLLMSRIYLSTHGMLSYPGYIFILNVLENDPPC